MCNYPPGAKYDSRAPYNQIDNKPIEIKLRVTITLTKDITLTTTDYTLENGIDEDGYYWEDYDFENWNVEKDIKENIDIPEDWNLDGLEYDIL